MNDFTPEQLAVCGIWAPIVLVALFYTLLCLVTGGRR